MPGLTNSQMLQALLSGAQGNNPAVEGAEQRKTLSQRAQQQSEAQQTSLQRLKDFLQQNKGILPEGSGVSVTPEGASVSRGFNSLQTKKMENQQENSYAKGLEKYSDVNGALQDLERITNRDGRGGIFTNPDAQLISSGKAISALPDSALGLAELTHAAAPGTAEERKALARVKLSLGHTMTGARMNPTMQKMIGDSLGGIASGDPQLMTKGLRGAAGIVGSQINTVQSGFQDQVKSAVHDRLGGDPMDFYGSIIKDRPTGAQPVKNSAFDPDAFLKGQ